MGSKRIAVLLSGCGFLDGSEIHESVLSLLALDNAGAIVECFAPDADQAETVNHLTGQKTAERRNMLVESARIARGKIQSAAQLKAADFEALVIPGGYGAAKNLCTYAADGTSASVLPEVERVVSEFITAKKPIGAICISPVLMARIFQQGGHGKVSLTIGTDSGTAKDIGVLGAEHVACSVKEFVTDKANKIVSTPAYMLGKGPGEVFVGIEKLVNAVLELC